MEFEEEHAPHPFTNFNKQPREVPTLCGNWLEERALMSVTGTTRYQPWTEPGGRDRSTHELQAGASVYATRQDVYSETQSFTRTVEHEDQTHPADWQSVARSTFQDPKTRQTMIEYKDAAALGPREKKLLAALAREADQLPAALEHSLTGKPSPVYCHHAVPPTMDSTYRAHFEEKDMTGTMIGTRVIKDRDGRPAVRDAMFLAETQIMQKCDADRILRREAAEAGATGTLRLADLDVPVTIYSEAVAAGAYTGTVSGTRCMSQAAPFNKFSNFSKPMTEYNKVVVDE